MSIFRCRPRADQLPEERRHVAGLRIQGDFLARKAQLAASVNEAHCLFDFVFQFTAGYMHSCKCFFLSRMVKKLSS